MRRYLHPTSLRPVGVEVDHTHHDVAPIPRRLRVHQQLVVLREVEPQIVIQVEGWIVAPDAVDPRDVVDDVARSVPVPDLVLVHLGVLVVIGRAWRATWRVLAQLEPAVDAVYG